MQTVRSLAKYALIVAITMPLVSCAFFDQLSAMRTFKDANFLYGRGDYEAAIEEYQVVLDAVRADPEGELAQGMSIAYFYVGNSYDSLYKPAFQGERENDEFLANAEEYYQLAADNIPNAEFKKLAMQYLVAVYGPDKLNDPTRRSEMLQQMLTLEPENPDNYFVLAQLYEESGLAEDAEMIYQAAVDLNTEDPNGYLQLAGFYNRTGNFESTIEQLQARARVEPDNPEAYYTISTFYWEKAFRDFRITQDQKAEYVLAGLGAADQAIGLNENYVDALVYKNILLRMQAGMLVCEDTDDTECINEQEGLIAEADTLRDRAQEIQDEARGAAIAAAQAEAEGN
tara:strand:- start:470 stop:1495 length:1026 start_codon:yes stop_codon:yes gene_type:complete